LQNRPGDADVGLLVPDTDLPTDEGQQQVDVGKAVTSERGETPSWTGGRISSKMP